MSEYEAVTVERRGAVALVTMNRPGALNAFNRALRRDMLLAVREVNSDDTIRVVVLTGAGRGFGSGADLTEIPTDDPTWRVDDQLNFEYKPALLEIHNSPKPWISAVQGPAAGISSAFAMACDLTVMSEDGYIYQAFAVCSFPDELAQRAGRDPVEYFLELIGEDRDRQDPRQDAGQLGP